MADNLIFDETFLALTGNEPFPWQREMYDRMVTGNPPNSCQIPTGLGKTAIMAIWLIARAKNPGAVPRRLVYVVNRRTVVDQSTEEAKRIRDNLERVADLRTKFGPLAISTLRGQFADNREWSADPSRPAIIVGTVDMIGSRLLFSGYGIGFKSKPLHAGFLGQDALLIHDEAHLEPAFQDLLIAIQREQERCHEFGHFRVMELSATSREQGEDFQLTDEERNPPEEVPDPPLRAIEVVWRRLKAKKGIAFVKPEGDKEKVADRIGKIARRYSGTHQGSHVLVFVNSLEDLSTVCKHLKGEQVQVLTGTMRGLERDQMADPRTEQGSPIFARYLKPPTLSDDEKGQWKITPALGTVYLACTSAGEVGIDISADHMVCDLTSFDRMAQRFGRVNRFGNGDAKIDIVHEAEPDSEKEDAPEERARWRTLELLQELPRTERQLASPPASPSAATDRTQGTPRDDERRLASPIALTQLRKRQDLAPKFQEAYTPEPIVLPVSEILFDAWALTTIRDRLPGRPAVESYLHGVEDDRRAETHVAWREEVGKLRQDFENAEDRIRFEKLAEDLLEDYPLKPHELLRDSTYRKMSGVIHKLEKLGERRGDLPVWIQEQDGKVVATTLGRVAERPLAGRTVLLPPEAGGLVILDGLSNGLLDGDAEFQPEHRHLYDVADEWYEDEDRKVRRRIRVLDDDPDLEEKTSKMRPVRTVELMGTIGDDEAETQKWRWFARPKSADDDGSKKSRTATTWDQHTADVEERARRFADALLTDKPLLHSSLVVAARFHDSGKRRAAWQRSIGNDAYPDEVFAKSGRLPDGRELRSRDTPEYYRHEFGSLMDALDPMKECRTILDPLPEEVRDLVLHLIAAHHGRARPHFPLEEGFDLEGLRLDADRIAIEVPRRFARLQRKYGRWGLAFLESLLRAADYAASADPSKTAEVNS